VVGNVDCHAIHHNIHQLPHSALVIATSSATYTAPHCATLLATFSYTTKCTGARPVSRLKHDKSTDPGEWLDGVRKKLGGSRTEVVFVDVNKDKNLVELPDRLAAKARPVSSEGVLAVYHCVYLSAQTLRHISEMRHKCVELLDEIISPCRFTKHNAT
jgi:hypothetical protein